MTKILDMLHDDDRGTAMTEFVICLPVFLIVFAGIATLAELEVASTAVEVRATKDLWSKAIPVQQSNISIHMQPAVSGAMAVGQIGSHFSQPIGDTLAIAKEGGLAAKGHFGESYFATKPVDVFADLGSPVEGRLTPDCQQIVPTDYTRDLVDDSLVKQIPSGSGPLAAFNMVISMAGVRPAIAAGIRYGIVVGQNSDSGQAGPVPYNVSAGYDVLVAPKPSNEWIATAVTRLAAESYKPYSGVLGIEFSSRL